MLERIKSRIVSSSVSLLEAMKQMDAQGVKTLFVFTEGSFDGILTIGDIQRAIIKNIPLQNPVSSILQKEKIYGYIDEPKESIQKKMQRIRAEVMPILDSRGRLVDVWFWSDLFKGDTPSNREKIDIPVVIMAGGKGTRLKPLTNVIPKPLIPIGEKTILEMIMDRFEAIGCKKFYMSVNYKSDMMQFYLDQVEHKYDIDFFKEDKPLGTIGSVSLLKGKITTPFFVSNCDNLIDQDFRDVYEYHTNNNNDMTIVTAIKTFRIPYGVIKTGEDGLMIGLQEKPEATYMINSGVYVMNPALIDEIPEGQFYHITDLMEKVRSRGGRVGCFPVSERSWRDMGEWNEYLKLIDVF